MIVLIIGGYGLNSERAQMDDETRAAFAKRLNGSIGEIFHNLREKAGLSLDQAAEAFATTKLEKIRRIEAGVESLRGLEIIELVSLYKADFSEVQILISEAVSNARAEIQLGQP